MVSSIPTSSQEAAKGSGRVDGWCWMRVHVGKYTFKLSGSPNLRKKDEKSLTQRDFQYSASLSCGWGQ